MRTLVRPGLIALLIAAAPAPSPAATPKQIGDAIARGAEYLKKREYAGKGTHSPGADALAGLAMLESGVPADDKAVRAVAAVVRGAAAAQTRTYNVALTALFLDRLGDPADEPLIQLMGVRLVAGQTGLGGWSYTCVEDVPPAVEQRLGAGLKGAQLAAGTPKPAPPPARNPAAAPRVAARLHPVVAAYSEILTTRAGAADDDNSNTQFAILGLWVARRHGVSAEAALAAVERRFHATQSVYTGGWNYTTRNGKEIRDPTPSMTCAGLLGLATGLSRRDEQRLGGVPRAPAAGPKAPRSDDPFDNPPPPAAAPEKPAAGKPAGDARDAAAERALACLGRFVAGAKGEGGGLSPAGGEVSEGRGLYFLWSLERVGVVYDAVTLGGVDWYAAGADALLPAQNPDGSWADAHGADVGTAFALLFLTRSNLTRDLKARKAGGFDGELRAGGGNKGNGWDTAPGVVKVPPAADPKGPPVAAVKAIPVPPGPDEAGELLKAPAADWAAGLARHRDAKGADHTAVLAAVATRAEGTRRAEAREALAARLTRMTADTLRDMLKADEPEVRRAAALSCAMKDDRGHVPDLIARLTDDSDAVRRAARAGLKSLTGQDFGPAPGATADERARAAAAWRAWHAGQK